MRQSHGLRRLRSIGDKPWSAGDLVIFHHFRSAKTLVNLRRLLHDGLGACDSRRKLPEQHSEGPCRSGRNYAVAEQSKFVCSRINADGCVQPSGRPMRLSTQRGLSCPFA